MAESRLDMIIDAVDEGVDVEYHIHRQKGNKRAKITIISINGNTSDRSFTSLRAKTVAKRAKRREDEREDFRKRRDEARKAGRPAPRKPKKEKLPELKRKEKEKLAEVNEELRKRSKGTGGRKPKGGDQMRLTSTRARRRKKNEGTRRLNEAFNNTRNWSQGYAYARSVDNFIYKIMDPSNLESKYEHQLADWGEFVRRLQYWKNHISDEALDAMKKIWYSWDDDEITTAEANRQFMAALDAGIIDRPVRKKRSKRS